jgi:hypothetical protein
MPVPAEELLKRAEQEQQVTPEGWIVRNRPVPECVNCLEDQATRAYKLFEYPLKIRDYDTRIRLAEAEVASLQRQLQELKYFNKTGPLFVTVENARLALLESLERLRNLRYERMLFVRLKNLEHELRQGVVVDQPVEAGVR